jgi:signal transduction histidine kinase
MSSPSESVPARDRLRLLESIKGQITLANLASVLVLLVVALVATVQFRELGRLVNAVSDGAEVLMRLSHAYDEREQLVVSFHKGYGEANALNEDARVRFTALAEDLRRHAGAARAKLGPGTAASALVKAEAGIDASLARAAKLDQLTVEDREVAAIEVEESLGDAVSQIGVAKLEASRAMERLLGGIKLELVKPQRLFWLAAALGGLIAVGISVFLRARVSRPIERLNLAVAELARGEPKPVSVSGRDELARLGLAFNGMAETITERNRSLKLVLDNVGDGLLICDLSGLVIGEPSRNALAWFGPAPAETRVADYVFGRDERLREWFMLGFDQLVSGVLTFEEAVEQIPREVRDGDRTFGVTLRPIVLGGELSRILVVVTDVTERRLLAHKEREARDVYNLASVALREPDAFTEFVADTTKRLSRVADGQSVLLELHTIKGNSSVMGCDYFASCVHDAESREVERLLDGQDVAELSRHWHELLAASEAAIGRSVNAALVIPRSEYESLCRALEQGRKQEAEMLARSWSMQRMDAVFQRLSRTAEQYATRVGKRVVVESDGGALAVPRGPLDELWSCLVHLVKNTVAHGVEREEGRLAKGKPAQGRVSLRAERQGDLLSVTVCDDGAGIDWHALGVEEEDGTRQLDALTSAGSTAREVSEVAGRGVGLSAVRKVVEGLGGRMFVRSKKDSGTDVVATVPASGVFRVSERAIQAAVALERR